MSDTFLRKTQIYVVGKFAVVFYRHEDELNEYMENYQIILYQGKFDDLPIETAAKVAEVHPIYFKHPVEDKVPYKVYRKLKSSHCFNPIWSLATLKSREEWRNHLPYVGIWQIFE